MKQVRTRRGRKEEAREETIKGGARIEENKQVDK